MLIFLTFLLAVAWKPHMYYKLFSCVRQIKGICKVYPYALV